MIRTNFQFSLFSHFLSSALNNYRYLQGIRIDEIEDPNEMTHDRTLIGVTNHQMIILTKLLDCYRHHYWNNGIDNGSNACSYDGAKEKKKKRNVKILK